MKTIKLNITSTAIANTISIIVLASPFILKITNIVNIQIIAALAVMLIASYVFAKKGLIEVIIPFFATGSFIGSLLVLGGL